MRVVRSDKCVARLAPGEVKRIPSNDERPLVGYYMACPACGRVQAIPATEQTFDEGAAMTMRPGAACTRTECAKTFSIEGGAFVVASS